MPNIIELNVKTVATIVSPQIKDQTPSARALDTGNSLPVNGQSGPVANSQTVQTVEKTAPKNLQSGTLFNQVPAQAIEKEVIEEVVRDLNEYVRSNGREIHFSVDDTTGRTIIKVISTATDETIRQIPSEEMLDFLQNMKELNAEKGSLFQDQV